MYKRGGKGCQCSHLHIEAKVLFLFKEEIKDKFPDKVRVQCVIDNFCTTKLEERQKDRQTARDSQHHADQSVHLVSWKL